MLGRAEFVFFDLYHIMFSTNMGMAVQWLNR